MNSEELLKKLKKKPTIITVNDQENEVEHKYEVYDVEDPKEALQKAIESGWYSGRYYGVLED